MLYTCMQEHDDLARFVRRNCGMTEMGRGKRATSPASYTADQVRFGALPDDMMRANTTAIAEEIISAFRLL